MVTAVCFQVCSNQKGLAFSLVPSPPYSFICFLWTHPISPRHQPVQKGSFAATSATGCNNLTTRNVVCPVCLFTDWNLLKVCSASRNWILYMFTLAHELAVQLLRLSVFHHTKTHRCCYELVQLRRLPPSFAILKQLCGATLLLQDLRHSHSLPKHLEDDWPYDQHLSHWGCTLSLDPHLSSFKCLQLLDLNQTDHDPTADNQKPDLWQQPNSLVASYGRRVTTVVAKGNTTSYSV